MMVVDKRDTEITQHFCTFQVTYGNSYYRPLERKEMMNLKMWTLCLCVSANPYRCLPGLFLKAGDGDTSPVAQALYASV